MILFNYVLKSILVLLSVSNQSNSGRKKLRSQLSNAFCSDSKDWNPNQFRESHYREGLYTAILDFCVQNLHIFADLQYRKKLFYIVRLNYAKLAVITLIHCRITIRGDIWLRRKHVNHKWYSINNYLCWPFLYVIRPRGCYITIFIWIL